MGGLVAGILLVAVGASGPAFAQLASSRFTIHVTAVDGRMVDISASYLQRDGDPLDPDTFAVFERERRLPATVRLLDPTALDVMVVADTYRNPRELETMQSALADLVEGLPDGSRVGVMDASDPLEVAQPLTTEDASALRAVRELQPTTDHRLVDAVGVALDQFAEPAPSPARRPVVVAFGTTYEAEEGVVDAMTDRLEAAEVPIYVIGSDRSVVGSAPAAFPLPLSGGRVQAGFGIDFVRFVDETVAALVDQHTISTEVSGDVDPAPITVRVRAGDELLEASTVAPLPQAPATRRTEQPLRSRAIAVMVGVLAVVFVLALITVPRRLAAARLARHRAMSPPVPVRAGTADDPPRRSPTGSTAGPGVAPAWRRGPEVAGQRPDRASARRDAGAGEPGSSLGGGQVEGRAAVRALLLARERPVRALFVAEGAREDELTELARASHVKVRTLRPDVHAMSTRSGAAEGVFATAAPLFPVELEELLRPAGRPGPAAPVLIAVNRHLAGSELGLLLRLAGAAAVSGMVLPRGRSVPITPEVTATAEGAIERLPIALVASVPAALARIQEHGGVVIGVEEGGDGHGHGLGTLALGAAEAIVALVVDGAGALEGHVRSRCDAVVGVGPLPQDRSAVEGLAQLALAALARARLAPDPWGLEPGKRS